MPIQLTPDHEVEFNRNPKYWTLRSYYEGKTREGEPVRKSNETYHPNLSSVLNYCLDQSVGDAETLEEMKLLIQRVSREMVEAVKDVGS